MLKSGEKGLIGPGSNNYGRDNELAGGMKIPRRAKLWLNVPAELAIDAAIRRIEDMGADTRLTEAQMLLGKAKDLVAEYIDEKLEA